MLGKKHASISNEGNGNKVRDFHGGITGAFLSLSLLFSFVQLHELYHKYACLDCLVENDISIIIWVYVSLCLSHIWSTLHSPELPLLLLVDTLIYNKRIQSRCTTDTHSKMYNGYWTQINILLWKRLFELLRSMAIYIFADVCFCSALCTQKANTHTSGINFCPLSSKKLPAYLFS